MRAEARARQPHVGLRLLITPTAWLAFQPSRGPCPNPIRPRLLGRKQKDRALSTKLTPSDLAEVEELLARWNEAVDGDSNDAEHEIGVDMSEFLWRLHGGLPEREL